MTIIIVLTAIYILNIIDYVQTMYAVGIFGIEFELNPVGRFLIENDLVFAAKMILVPALLIIMGYLLMKLKCVTWLVYIPFVAYLVVVIRNFIIIENMSHLNMILLQF